MTATPLCAFAGTCLVKRHRINAEMWAKLDKIKHTGECTDAGQCSKCAALFMFSNMGFLMRVWWLFLELESWKSVWPELESVDKALHSACSESGVKGQPSSSALWITTDLIRVLEIIHIHYSLVLFYVGYFVTSTSHYFLDGVTSVYGMMMIINIRYYRGLFCCFPQWWHFLSLIFHVT